jgi:hypothetical protein
MEINLNDEPDKFVWGLTTSGIFSVKSMHADMLNDHARYLPNIFGN